jgi:hypothetical protein
MVRLPEREVV